MKKTITTVLAALLCVPIFAESFVPGEGTVRFRVYQSTVDRDMKEVRTTPFSPHFTSYMKYIDLDSAKPSHEYLGLGISLTDASCWLLREMGREKGYQLLKDAFTTGGMNLSIVRLNCGASDYATALYNYDDTPDDVNMKHFSVARDEKYMIPVIKDVMAVQENLYVFSSIWSCPGWMKDSGQMCGGRLLDKYMPAFANYWAAYIKAYQQHGIHIDAITVQNEPLTDQRGANPATLITTAQEMALASKHIPAAFRKNGLDTKIWIYDHNYKYYDRVIQELSDPAVRSSIDAVAWHPYSGKPEMMQEVRRQFPDVTFHLTERGMNYPDIATQDQKWCADLVMGALNNGCSSYCGWCLALDQDGQPVTGRFACRGLYEINLDTGEVVRTPLYTLFRHIGPYVKKGAQIMAVEQPEENLSTITFRNPDGQYVIVVACGNRGADRQRVQIKFKDQYLAFALPLNTWSLSTIVIDKQ